ncbi:c-type cytochrome [Variovorax sp. HJSM1_2]|uniref:c-type cytochrome n=1 Tax=Variovorax sp. HJSM1_2 TaxID=3366263 RepID=UPI003BE73A1C
MKKHLPEATPVRPHRALIWVALLLVFVLGTSRQWLALMDDEAPREAPPAIDTPAGAANVARGAYLARVGNCAACHTSRGGTAYAGGRGIDTPFGTVYSSNLTPDDDTGLGRWSSTDFWNALHHGRSRDGRRLNPVFPYTSYTVVTREDSDALFSYLQSLPATTQANTPDTLRWPYGTQAAMAVWRALYFTPGGQKDEIAPPANPSARSAEWQRGAYLVTGLGHCAACHSPRNRLGGLDSAQFLAGGQIPMQNWYAPSLSDPHEAGVADWPQADIVRLLQAGVSPGGSALGPMAEVVLQSTQYLNTEDLNAVATYLKALPPSPHSQPGNTAPKVDSRVAASGAQLYTQHCSVCHGMNGKGVPGAYPPLGGNRAVTMPQITNLVQMVLKGGYAPATAGNPRPYGMPPFALQLNDRDIAAVLTHLRTSWGNQAGGVSELDVIQARGVQSP